MIPLSEPSLGGNEARYLRECIDTGYVSSAGPFVGRFEREFAAAVGAPRAVACASGTAALHVALLAAGAGPGSVVAVSDFTFIASANAAHYTGAALLLVDSEPETWNMNTELLHDEVVRRARLGRPIPDIVEVVHVLGHPARMEPLFELRDRFWIDIVEDAAESLGASWTEGTLAGRQVGTAGGAGCFSFNGNKIITAGGGGAIVTADHELADVAARLSDQAKAPGEHYRHDDVGFNYRLTNIAAAVASAQLEQLPDKVAAKRALAARYRESLRPLPVTPPPSADWADPTFWLYSILLDDPGLDPAKLVAALAADGIQTRRLWPPLHDQRPYRSADRIGGAVADDLYRRGLSLPSSAHLSEHDQRTVVAALASILAAS
ncbi:DegT/DnrJ/EryC1/StrS aminotransferase [Jiangella aurantiaca]|uniref:DegT/DnrJ/EryC1/StrS aminotransferase n=1 Tax=Jiangella aurantiaca TaxID=2530373 RepID=A0A4R5AH35_9ACTN|nr:DegT/DnrJ/EryC1/StrS family aminotransferase [Jiangella aurantiaca]TDD70730.1 DegT/DnrJ/EryC1/StrS aminotransferase [Jiangella aurantiaca]